MGLINLLEIRVKIKHCSGKKNKNLLYGTNFTCVMELSVALIGVGFLLLAIPQLNARVDMFVKNIPYVNMIRAPAATILCVIGFLGLLMGWF